MADPTANRPSRQPTVEEREALRERVTAWFDVGLSVLGVAFLALLLVEFTVDLDPPWSGRVTNAQLAIWAVFVVAFAIELTLSPSKTRYLRRNWLVVLSLAIPALRVFRAAQAVRALRGARAIRGLNLARSFGALNRARKSLADFARVSQFGYLVLLTVVVILTAGAAGYVFERDHPESLIRTPGDAFWWSSTVVTTVNAQLEAVTLEGRVIALALRVYGLVVVGYLTAQIAVFLLGRRPDDRDRETADGEERPVPDLRRLEAKIDALGARLDEALATQNGTGASGEEQGTNPGRGARR